MSALRALIVLALATSLAGCGDAGCLKTRDPACRIASPCKKLAYACDAGSLEVRTLGAMPDAPGGEAALGRHGDVLIGNERLVAVIAGLGDQNYIDLSGGALLDLQPRGRDADALNEVSTVVGVLPRDSAYYTQLELIDERPLRVGVQLRGTLYEQPDVTITTLYEVRPCEPGVRVRSTVYNGTPDPQAWTLSDGWYWSGREPEPFTPGKGRGFTHPPLELASVNDIIDAAPYLAASSHTGPPVSYGEVGCVEPALEGFHSEQVSSFGVPRAVIDPRGISTFERFIVTADRGDVASSIDLLLEARKQLFVEPYVTLTGSLTAYFPLGSEREASILFTSGDETLADGERDAVTQVVPDRDGKWSVRVPAGRRYTAAVWSLGRKVAEQALGQIVADRTVELAILSRISQLQVTVRDGAGMPMDAEVFVVPADDATRDAVIGSFHGAFVTCAPWLGPAAGASPACNRFLTWHAAATAPVVEVPTGRYDVYAYHGPFFSLGHAKVQLALDVTAPIELTVRELQLQPQGTLTGDLHVHGAASFDSSIPDWDRVLSFAATNVQVVVATDHDVVTDYADVARQLGISSYVSTVSGVETTGHMPFFKIPGSDFPLVIGHYNFWPLRYAPTEPRNGGPFDELIEPGELFDRATPLYSGEPVIELNHPWAAPQAGRDLGFPRALALDTHLDLPDHDDGTVGGIYVRTPAGGHANDAHDAQEVMNGSHNDVLLQYRAFWFYTLNQGKPKVGTANSDSHSLSDETIGTPRNVVYTDTVAGPAFDIDRYDVAIKAGRLFGTNGPVIEAAIIDGDPEVELPYGMGLLSPGASARLRISVSAAPWIPVDEVRIIVNGAQVVLVRGDEITPAPPDAFGTGGLVRLVKELPLAKLLAGVAPTTDAWIVVEAGTALPLAADLGGGLHDAKDGIPDTGDNNGDGVVDLRDVAIGKKVGPLLVPAAPPRGSALDPFFQITGGYPFAYTNPFLLDRNDNGRFDRVGVLP